MEGKPPKPLFLAPKARRGNGFGYVNDPAQGMRDEPECVGPAIVDAYSESALFWQSLRHAAEVQEAQQSRRLLNAEQRLADVQRRAKQQHVNVSGEVHVLSSMLERAKRGGRNEPPGAVKRLESLEARLDGLSDAA